MTRASPVRDEDGAVLKWYGSNTDIDDIKQAEERRRELIDTLAHDLQNPLAAIKAQSQVLQRRIARGDPIDPGIRIPAARASSPDQARPH